MQAPLSFRSAHIATLPFFQKATAVVVIVEFTHIQDYEKQREGAYAQDKLNIQARCGLHV